jgi:hypothetical protein
MKLFAPATTLGVTLKFVLDLDEEMAEKLRQCPPGSVRICGLELDSKELTIGIGDQEIEPARVWVQLDEVHTGREEEYLERTA